MHETQLNRLKRIEGQVRGISKMIDEGRYCMEILTQLKAIKSALARVENNIIEEHLGHCVHQAIESSDDKQKAKALDEIRDLLSVRPS